MGRQGLFTTLLRPYLRFYAKDFHPWNHDNRELIEAWKKQQRQEPDREAA